MPKAYYKELRLHKLYAISQLIGILAIIVMAGLYLIAWDLVLLGICLFLVILFGISAYLNQKANRKQGSEPWIVQTECRDTKALLDKLGCEPVTESCSIVFHSQGKYRVRLLTTIMEHFDTKEASALRQSANRKINAKYAIQSEGSFFEIARCVRVNLALVSSDTKELINWIRRTEQTLSRNEIVVNLALVTDSGTFLVPRIKSGHSINEVSRYEAAVHTVLQKLR